MDERINSAILTLYLIGKAAEKPLAMAVYVRFYLRESPAEDHAGKSTVHITDSPETWHSCTTSLVH